MMKPAFFPLIALFTACLIFLGWNSWQGFWLRADAAKNIWYEEKVAKVHLMETRRERPDVVFVGSSHVQNHIDTGYFSRRGLPAFNLGVPGVYWEDYAFRVEKAAERARKGVVIYVVTDELFNPVPCPAVPTLSDIAFFWKHVASCDLLNPEWLAALARSLPMNRFHAFEERRTEATPTTQGEIDEINARFGLDLRTDARRVSYVRRTDRRSSSRFVVVFENGDGLVVSDRMRGKQRSSSLTDHSAQSFDPNALNYMKALIRVVLDRGLQVAVVVGRGHWLIHYKIDQAALADELSPARVIFLGDRDDDSWGWADEGHYDSNGARLFTEALHRELSAMFTSEP